LKGDSDLADGCLWRWLAQSRGGYRPSGGGRGGGVHPDPEIRGGRAPGPPGPSPGSATAVLQFKQFSYHTDRMAVHVDMINYPR